MCVKSKTTTDESERPTTTHPSDSKTWYSAYVRSASLLGTNRRLSFVYHSILGDIRL